jgi:TPR repeat protein
LAKSHCCGFGKFYNNNEAYRWYCASAKQGHVEALVKLGVFFSGGEGFASPLTKLRQAGSMPKDNALSFAFFSMAAEKGHEEALSKVQELSNQLTKDERAQSLEIIPNFPLMSCDLDTVLTENGIE